MEYYLAIKEWSPALRDHMDETGGHWAKQTNQAQKTNTEWSHSPVESTKVDLIEVESRMVVSRGWGEQGGGKDGKGWSTGMKLQSHGARSSFYCTVGWLLTMIFQRKLEERILNVFITKKWQMFTEMYLFILTGALSTIPSEKHWMLIHKYANVVLIK
jgi:hypothetical protein